MTQPIHFGQPGRVLFGLLHSHAGSFDSQRAATVACAPPLQEGIRSHRALWSISESMAAAGSACLCFDWFGSGDSGGEDTQLSLDGMGVDLHLAADALKTESGCRRVRWLALRSAALPLMAYLSMQTEPVEVVLWDPQLDGRALVDSWRMQHRQQLEATGRYPHARHESEPGELLGFAINDALLSSLESLDAASLALPAGSRVRLALWSQDESIDRFIRTQQAQGIEVDVTVMDAAERPGWDDPRLFGNQVFPRKSVSRLAQQLSMEAMS